MKANWIPVFVALLLAVSSAGAMNYAVTRTLQQQEERFAVELAEAVSMAVEEASTSRDIQMTQLFNWYVELRRDLYTEWTRGIKPVKKID